MVKIADWKTNPLDHPTPFNAIRNNHFPNQYYCNRNKKIQMFTGPYRFFKTSTTALPSNKWDTGAALDFFQIAPFLHFFLFKIQCSGLNYISHHAVQAPPCHRERCRAAVTAKTFLSSSFVSVWNSSHRLFLGLEIYFSSSSLFYGFSVAHLGQLHVNIY